MIYLLCQAIIITHIDAGKRLRIRDTQEITQRINHNKGNPIENWLSTLPLSLENLVDPFLQKTPENMPRYDGLSLRCVRISTRITPSGTETAGGVRASDFRDRLGARNIFIDTDASTELVKKAKEITEELCPEMHDALAQELAVIAKNLEMKTEQEIVMELGSKLIPAKKEDDRSLKRMVDRLWSNAVDLPLDPSVVAILPSLPIPKPDLVFGYSEKAFNTNQFQVMKLLEIQPRKYYAMPDGKVSFPFLDIEFKALATGGNQFVASNQAANSGAIAMQGTLELARRISAEGKIVDSDEPQFFSLSIDNWMARINVHWLSRKAENEAYCYHMTMLARYFLDAKGIKAVNRAIKGILHYGLNERLIKICDQLDIYSQKVKEKAIIDKGHLASDSLPEEQQQQRPPRKRKNVDSLTNRRQAPRLRRARNLSEDVEEEEEEGDEEGAAAEQMKILKQKDDRLNLRNKATANQRAKKGEPTVRKSARLLARGPNN